MTIIETSAESLAIRTTSQTPIASRVTKEFTELLTRDFCRQHLIIDQGIDVDGLTILAVSSSTRPDVIHNVGVRLKRIVTPQIAADDVIASIIDESFGVEDATDSLLSSSYEGESIAIAEEAIDSLVDRADRDLLSTQGKGPVIKLVDALLFEALTRRASDVHVQTRDDATLIRYRVDGVLATARSLPPEFASPLISRIKVMGRMDIAERRIPQDGRATVRIGTGEHGRDIDLRISTLPTSHGERAVIRLLDHSSQLSDFESLGMPPDIAESYLRCATQANGIFLLTGPTGSGKTTSLYATLRTISSDAINIMTIEDPIEYDLSTSGLNISQAQVNEKKGVTFARGLRHILRQDPDVVMVGEIRDAETARIAIQSSLTGHLVFSTLHTNDAPSAITRMSDLGIESYLVSASLSAVLAQRLVRRLHAPCDGTGCIDCAGSGYLGRCGIFELLVLDDAMRTLIAANAPLEDIRTSAVNSGMRTLRADGMRLVDAGLTSLLEIDRVTHGMN